MYDKANNNGFHLSNWPTNSRAVGGKSAATMNKSHGEVASAASCEESAWGVAVFTVSEEEDRKSN